MNVQQKSINQYIFTKICDISPKRDENNVIIEYFPQNRYINLRRLELNRYGLGPFCRFKIPTKCNGKSGVYGICNNNSILYIGETQNLGSRFNQGYGIISPRKCFKGGQSTNCRINNKILSNIKNGENLSLYFFETYNHKRIEKQLIIDNRPPWNN